MRLENISAKELKQGVFVTKAYHGPIGMNRTKHYGC